MQLFSSSISFDLQIKDLTQVVIREFINLATGLPNKVRKLFFLIKIILRNLGMGLQQNQFSYTTKIRSPAVLNVLLLYQ